MREWAWVLPIIVELQSHKPASIISIRSCEGLIVCVCTIPWQGIYQRRGSIMEAETRRWEMAVAMVASSMSAGLWRNPHIGHLAITNSHKLHRMGSLDVDKSWGNGGAGCDISWMCHAQVRSYRPGCTHPWRATGEVVDTHHDKDREWGMGDSKKMRLGMDHVNEANAQCLLKELENFSFRTLRQWIIWRCVSTPPPGTSARSARKLMTPEW